MTKYNNLHEYILFLFQRQRLHSFLVSWSGVRLCLVGMSATNWTVVPTPDDRWWMWRSRWNENWQGKPKYSEETTNPTWPDLSWKPGRRDEKPAVNRLSYGTAKVDITSISTMRMNDEYGSVRKKFITAYFKLYPPGICLERLRNVMNLWVTCQQARSKQETWDIALKSAKHIKGIFDHSRQEYNCSLFVIIILGYSLIAFPPHEHE
jgi:hypothetical protein